METTIFFENNFIFILLFIEYLKSYFPIHLSFFFVLMWQNILYEILASETTIVLLKYFFISPIGCGTTVSDSDKEILVIVTLKWQLFSPRKNIKRKCCKWNFFLFLNETDSAKRMFWDKSGHVPTFLAMWKTSATFWRLDLNILVFSDIYCSIIWLHSGRDVHGYFHVVRNKLCFKLTLRSSCMGKDYISSYISYINNFYG